MSTTSIKVEGGRADVRLTPWDERAIGIRTAEVLRLEVETQDAGIAVLEKAEQWSKAEDAHYLFGRFNAESVATKSAVQACHHDIIECSLVLTRNGFDGLPTVPARMRPELREVTDGDMVEIEKIAHDDFRHGRFHEDPAIDPALAAKRNVNWIRDLARQGLARVGKSGKHVIGFHAERIDPSERHAELILTGTAARYAVLAMPLWIVALESLRDRGANSCSTLVSAANTGVVNLYAKLGFRYQSTLFGFRKFL